MNFEKLPKVKIVKAPRSGDRVPGHRPRRERKD